MASLFDLFVDGGGVWLLVLGALTRIAYVRHYRIKDEAKREEKALSTRWLMRAAVGLALLAWAWNYGRLFAGDAYLRGSGVLPELSTGLSGMVLLLAGVAWHAITRWPRVRPWLTHGIVLAVILSSRPLLPEAPEEVLTQESEGSRHAIGFVQRRLAALDCFAAVSEPERKDGSYDALTALAVISFQRANDLIRSSKIDRPGEVRPDKEFRLLARPFPFLFGPRPCQKS